MTRTRYYKGLEPTLQGPHFNNPDGALFLPGTEHRSELHVTSAFGRGIHFTSHRRVASRWAPVVAEVEVLGATFLIPEKVAPRYRKDIPADLAMGKYNKYRTDHLRVTRVVGIAAPGGNARARVARGYSRLDLLRRYLPLNEAPQSWSRSTSDSFLGAGLVLDELNRTLRGHNHHELRLTGAPLERLRSDDFQLWEVEEVKAPAMRRWEIKLVLESSGPDGRELDEIVGDVLGDELYNRGDGVTIVHSDFKEVT